MWCVVEEEEKDRPHRFHSHSHTHPRSHLHLLPTSLPPSLPPLSQFRALVPALLRAGLGVAVVTFSKQDHQIRTVLRLVFGEEFSARIHLRTNSFKFRRRRGSAWDTGKQLHIESVIEAANEDAEKKSTAAEEEEEEEGGGGAVRGPSLVMTQCALIDDDLRNINVARENGVHSHHFTNDSNLCVLTESRGAGRCISLHLIPHSEMIHSHIKQKTHHLTPPYPTLIHKRKIDEKIWLQRTLALDPRPRLRLPLRLQLPVQVRE